MEGEHCGYPRVFVAKLAPPPVRRVAVEERNFAGASVDAGDFGAAATVEAAFDDGAVGKGDAVVLVGDVFAKFIDQFDGDPVFFFGRNGLIGSWWGATGLARRACGGGAHVLIGVVGRVVESVARTAHDCFLG